MTSYVCVALLAASASGKTGGEAVRSPNMTLDAAMRLAEQRKPEGFRALYRIALTCTNVEEAEQARDRLMWALHADPGGWLDALVELDGAALREYLSYGLSPPLELPPRVESQHQFARDVIAALSVLSGRSGATGALATFVLKFYEEAPPGIWDHDTE